MNCITEMNAIGGPLFRPSESINNANITDDIRAHLLKSRKQHLQCSCDPGAALDALAMGVKPQSSRDLGNRSELASILPRQDISVQAKKADKIKELQSTLDPGKAVEVFAMGIKPQSSRNGSDLGNRR